MRSRRAMPSASTPAPPPTPPARPVDMALDQVAAQRVAVSKRQLEIHRGPCLEVPQRRERQRLVHRIGLEPARAEGGRGEACPAHRDRIALPKPAGEPGPDTKTGAVSVAVDALDVFNLSDYSREHRLPLLHPRADQEIVAAGGPGHR